MKSIAFAFFICPCFAFANDWDALNAPDAIAVMRHALAPGTSDPTEFALGDCATQRNLDDRGREQARKTGDAFRENGIVFDKVFVGQWCRTRETAELLNVGPVLDASSLNSFFQDFSTREHQTRQTIELIEETVGRPLLVTHQVNISALTGIGTRSGEMLIIRLMDGEAQVIGSILIDP